MVLYSIGPGLLVVSIRANVWFEVENLKSSGHPKALK
jgi:hypothetical protein